MNYWSDMSLLGLQPPIIDKGSDTEGFDPKNRIIFSKSATMEQLKSEPFYTDIKLLGTNITKLVVPENKTQILLNKTIDIVKDVVQIKNNGDYSITWTSSDETLATVSADGKITAKNKEGNVVITANLVNGNKYEIPFQVVKIINSSTSSELIIYFLIIITFFSGFIVISNIKKYKKLT